MREAQARAGYPPRLLVSLGLANNPNLKPNPKPNLNPDQVLEYDGAELDDLASELEAELEVTVMRKKELNGALLPLTLTLTQPQP